MGFSKLDTFTYRRESQQKITLEEHIIERVQSGCSCEDVVARQPENHNLRHLKRHGTHVW